MRFKSEVVGGYQIFAVSGTNTISFGIDADAADKAGLIGFAIEREDVAAGKRRYVSGFKVFESVLPNPDETLRVTTFDHPMQSFVWDDFTAQPGYDYVYYFHPVKGSPTALDRSAPAVPIKVRTEALYTDGAHDVFFNRGIASSQAYAREFQNKEPKDLPPAEAKRALQWLSRDLDDAILKFIKQAEQGDTLLGAFYEFRYEPIAQALKAALDRGVEVRLVLDGKKNGRTGKDGVVVPDFPRTDNVAMVAKVGLPATAVTWREKNRDSIAHNKFMVLLKGGTQPAQVWTGSTNLSEGGIHGQTNVGHWVRDATVAGHFRDYWQLLSGDPGKPGTGTTKEEAAAMAALRTSVGGLLPTPTDWRKIDEGTTSVFSPRAGGEVLDMYSSMLIESAALGCVTLAFGISAVFKDRLVKNNGRSPMTFLMLEKKDEAPRPPKPPKVAKPFVRLGSKQNVYAAWGSFLADPLYRWTRETNAGQLKLNQHVSYIHSKFLLHDPLGADPIVVTGSANFSNASTNDNDENMLLIRGEKRVADIYFTEFNRLFFHYYFRSVHEETSGRKSKDASGVSTGSAAEKASLFLDETDGWLKKYLPGSLKAKRVTMFTRMALPAE